MPYFERVDDRTFAATEHVSGAWREDEQHIAPALGLLTHAVEADRDRRRDDGLQVTRLSFDILGTIPVEPVEIDVRVLRPGRTAELVEATLAHGGRAAVVLRAWLQQTRDTAAISGGELPGIPGPGDVPEWEPTIVWPGGFIRSVELRRGDTRPGRGHYWVRTPVPLLDEPVSTLATFVGIADIANGMVVREDPRRVAFPNVDLTAHVFREPVAGWLGFDTTVTFGAAGVGVTSSVLHDETGPFGVLAQSLTVRPLG